MATFHRIPSIHSKQAMFFLTLLLTSFLTLPSITNAQQSKNPNPKEPCGCGGGGALTTAPTNAGTEFMLCFEENIDAEYDNTPAYLEVYVASLGDTATVTVTSKAYPALNKVFFLQPNSSISYDISDDMLQGNPMHDLWIVSDEQPDNRVVQVHATSPVVCYGLDYKTFSADAFCAIDSESAGTDYEVMSYPNSEGFNLGEPPTSSQFAVAAFQDNTTVTITPTAPTLGGHAVNVPFQVTLQQGQCVQVQTDSAVGGLDLTGSIVSADHPITVYGSHVRTDVPLGASGNFSRDMLLETMPPTSAWGDAFVLDAIQTGTNGQTNPDGDLMRVLALNNNTVVTVNGTPWATLNAGQFQDAAVKGPTLVSASGPLLVGEIEHSDQASGDNGDPFLAIVPPVDQTFNNYTFFISSDNNFQQQSVVISADNTCVNSITLDGQPVPAAAFTAVPGSVNGRQFSILEYTQSGGSHTISTTAQASQGFSILAYGAGTEVSYGYTAGELLVPKRTIRIEYPPEAMNGGHSNLLNFHNTSYQPAYLDSAVFIPDNPDASVFGIHTQEDVALDIGRMDVGASSQIHLVSDRPLSGPVSGTVKIYAHLPSYLVLEPAEIPFTLYANSEADVAGANGGLGLTATASPNPFSSYTTINFSIPQAGDLTMTLYDELGRVVEQVASGEYPAGPYSIPVYRKGLPNGVYVCEINSEKLNIHTRVPVVAGE